MYSEILPLLDLTSLNEFDTEQSIAELCQKALTSSGMVAAVCIFPRFVKFAKKQLASVPIKIATVVNFPHGTDSLETVQTIIRTAIIDGADEIDVVFPYLDYLNGDQVKPFEFVRACKKTVGEKIILKVILETGALIDPLVIADVSHNVCLAGADFLKTSTGKISVGATLDAARIMLEAIKKFPRAIGVKVSGGIRTPEQAKQYIELAKQIMGEPWVTPAHFRIGTSRLIV